MISFAGSYWCQGFCHCRNPSPGTRQGWSRPELSESLHVKGNAAKALAQPSVLSHTGVSRLTSHGGKCHHHANCPCHTASHRGGLYCSCRSDLKPLKTLREVRPSLQNHGGSSPVQGPGGPAETSLGSEVPPLGPGTLSRTHSRDSLALPGGLFRFWGNKVGDEGAQALAEAVGGHQSLKWLR